ncbi:MAG: acetate--CoA ligase family protein [Burkholderiaceae bacterium]
MTESNKYTDLSALFSPRSVAIIGASDDPDKIAGRPLAAMLHYGFAGAIYAVNSRRDTVQGIKAYSSVSELPEVPDLAVLAVPSTAVIDAIRDCANLGVKFVVVFAGGFAETGESGRERQAQMTAIARQAGMRILGPNCLGAMDFNSSVYATFSKTTEDRYTPGKKGLAVVSQSGALGNYMLTQAMDLGLPIVKWITTGNESDLEFAEVLQYMAFEPNVTGILAYQEGARDGPRLAQALRDARDQKKPVALIKVGSTDIGAKAVVSHTDALAGDDAVYDALFRECGVYRVHGIEQLLDAGTAMAQSEAATGNKLLLATISGGVGVIMAEAAERFGLSLPDLSDDSKRQLREAVPFMSPNNPLDVTGQVVQDFSLLQRALELGLQDTKANIAVTFIGRLARVPAALRQYVDTMKALRVEYPQTRFISVGMFDTDTLRSLQDDGLLVYADPTRAISAASALATFGNAFRTPPVAQPDISRFRLERPDGLLNEADCYALLQTIGIQSPPYRIASDRSSAERAFDDLGSRVVMKILSADIAHKSDIGGVKLGIESKAAAASAFDQIHASVRAALPSARVEGVLLVDMTPVDLELVIGARVDPQLGPVVLVGAGGILVEILNDVVVHTAPVTIGQAEAMVASLKSASLLKQWRGRPPRDVAAVAQALSRLSCFIAANVDWVESIEINPYVPGMVGEGGLALDCAVQMTTGGKS